MLDKGLTAKPQIKIWGWQNVPLFLFLLLSFLIPVEHRYDKWFRHFSLTLIPTDLFVSSQYDKKIAFYFSDLIAVFLFFFSLFRTRLQTFLSHPFWLVFLFSLLSIIASPFMKYPIPYFRLLHLFTPLALFSFLTQVLNREEKHKLRNAFLHVIFYAGCLQAVIAILQYFHQAPLHLRFFGENPPFASFSTLDGHRWIFDAIFQRSSPSSLLYRATGTLPHANVLGGFLFFSLLISYPLFLKSSLKKSIAYAISIAVQLFALTLTYSRAAMLGWILASAVWFLLTLKEEKFRKKLTLLLLLLFSTCFLNFSLLHRQILDRGGFFNYNQLAKSSDEIRISHQKIAFEILKTHPFLGLGWSQFSEHSSSFFPKTASASVRSTAPHNIFLFLACETGILSLLSFLFSLALLFCSHLWKTPDWQTHTFFSLLLGFVFIGCCDFYPLLFQQGKLMFFLSAGFLYRGSSRQESERCNLNDYV